MTTIKYTLGTAFLFLAMTSFGQIDGKQIAMTMKVNENVKGLCDKSKVYSLYMMRQFPGSNATEGQYPLNEIELLKLLNEKVTFLKDNPKYKGKFSVRVIINCKGELVSCDFESKTKNNDLNNQILEIFKSLDGWGAGTFNGELVDSTKPFYLKIKGGEIVKE
jgi:hypothetical protein